MSTPMSVTEMFDELIRLGYLSPATKTTEFTLPGRFKSVPSIVAYGTPDLPIHIGVHKDAELVMATLPAPSIIR